MQSLEESRNSFQERGEYMKAKILKLKNNRKTQIEEVRDFTKDILIHAIHTKFQTKIDKIAR